MYRPLWGSIPRPKRHITRSETMTELSDLAFKIMLTSTMVGAILTLTQILPLPPKLRLYLLIPLVLATTTSAVGFFVMVWA